jgi:hypothetical protein
MKSHLGYEDYYIDLGEKWEIVRISLKHKRIIKIWLEPKREDD